LWFLVFSLPMFLWTPDTGKRSGVKANIAQAARDLVTTIKALPQKPSFLTYLMSSMFYRDALNGLYTFGGIYAAGVLGWTITQIGIFGIIASAAGALGAWLGGKVDSSIGSKPVIKTCIWVLIAVSGAIILTTKTSVLGMPVADGSSLPTILFYICGAFIGAAGGSLQAASRTMVVHQADPAHITEAFGLFALTGKATSFIAPFAIAAATAATGSQRLGVSPVIALFLIGLVLLYWVKTKSEA
jgi:UMF1 family MFS transporter